MENNSLFDKLKSYIGLHRPPPSNEFRNPIWGSDDDDDGDELYTRDQQMDVFQESSRVHEEFAKQIHEAFDMFKTFGHMLGDMKDFFNDEEFMPAITDMRPNTEDSSSGNIRDYYLKPGFHSQKYEQPKQDIDLDGKISSNEISGLLKKSDENQNLSTFNGHFVPGKSFFQTIITTSVTKPDGTVETRRIVKNGNEVVEETTTSMLPGSPTSNTGFVLPPTNDIMNSAMNQAMSQFSTLFTKFY